MPPSRPSSKAAAARQTTRLIRDLVAAYRSLLEDSLREDGLSLPQLRLLKAVSEQSEVSGAALARRCQITPQTLQATLERAVRQGWIVRATSARNHRILTAALTASGRKLLAVGEAKAAEIEARLWRGVPLRTLQQLNDILARGAANLRSRPGEAYSRQISSSRS